MTLRASVIMPVYNVGNYVETALESVRNQKIPFDRLEVVVVDDASTDKTASIVKSYIQIHPELDIKFSSHHNNMWAGATRNTASELASGDIFIYLDGDDLLHRYCVSKCLKIFENDSIGFVYSDHAGVTPDAGLYPDEKDILYVNKKPDFNLLKAIKENYVGHVKSVRVSENIPFDTSLLTCQDTDWWLRLAINGVKFYHIPKVLYYWRRGIESTTYTRISREEADKNHELVIEIRINALKEKGIIVK